MLFRVLKQNFKKMEGFGSCVSITALNPKITASVQNKFC